MYDMEFTIMHKDTEIERIKVIFSKGIVEYTNFVDKIPYKQFYKKPNIYQLYDWLEERCFPRNRVNLDDLLKDIGLTRYEPKKIVRITHGVMWEDFIWIKFKGEDINWDDVKLRG